MRTPPSSADARFRHAGTTLIEQIVTIAVIGVLSAIALPALGTLRKRAALQSAQLELMATLQHARGVAVTSGRATQVCPSSDGTGCAESPRWESGWLVTHAARGKDEVEPPPLRARPGYAGITILGDSGRKRTRFRPDGSAGGSTNTWRLCRHGNPDDALVVIVANSGRVRGAPATREQAAQCAAAND